MLQLFVLSLSCIPVPYNESLSSHFFVQYPELLGMGELLIRNSGGSSIPFLWTVFYSDHNNNDIKTVNFLLFPRREKALIFATWSCFLIERNPHNLKVARYVMSSIKLLHIGVQLLSRVQSCWHILTHCERVKLACTNSSDWFTIFWWTS